MRGPCCFSNCSPSPAPVTILNQTTNLVVAGDQLSWKQERFAAFTLLSGGDRTIVHPATAVSLTALAVVALARAPVSPYSVKVFIGDGTVRQRPLLAYSESGGGSAAFDYFVVGDKLYFTFDPSGEVAFVDYVGIPRAGDPTALEVGAMQTIDVGDATDPAALAAALPPGWVWADGTTVYSKIAHSALYAFLRDNGDGTMIEHDADATNVSEGYATDSGGATLIPGTAFAIPPGGFVVRYLAPFTFGPLPDPGVGVGESPLYRYRDPRYRVAVKI